MIRHIEKNVKRAVIKIFIVTNHMMFCDTIYILLCDESHIMPRQITFVNVNFYIFECSFITFSCLTKTHFKMCLSSPFFMCCSHLLNCVMSHCIVIHLLLYTMLPVTFNILTTIVSYYYCTLLLNCSTTHPCSLFSLSSCTTQPNVLILILAPHSHYPLARLNPMS